MNPIARKATVSPKGYGFALNKLWSGSGEIYVDLPASAQAIFDEASIARAHEANVTY